MERSTAGRHPLAAIRVPSRLSGGNARRIAAAALASGLALTALAVSSAGATAAGGTLNIAVVAPVTGPGANFGVLLSAPCKAAVSVINASGGVRGNSLSCLSVNDFGDPADAVPSVEKAFATTSGIVSAVGLESNTAATVVPLVEKQNIPFFTANGLDSFDRQTNAFFYRMSPADDQNGAAYAVAAKQLGFSKVAVIYANNIGAEGNIPGTLAAVQKLKMKLTINLTIPGDETSYASTVQRVISSKPQAIIFYADPQTSGTFMQNYSQLTGGKLPPMITAGSNEVPDFLTALKPVVSTTYLTKQIYYVGQSLDSKLPAYKTYAAAMTATGAPAALLGAGVISALYDGINIMSLAMIESHSTSGPVYNKAIVALTQPHKGAVVVHNFAAGKAALNALHKIQYVGTGGTIKFNSHHNFVGNFGIVQENAAGIPSQLSVIPGAKVLANA